MIVQLRRREDTSRIGRAAKRRWASRATQSGLLMEEILKSSDVEKGGHGEIGVRIRRIPRIICWGLSFTGTERSAWRSGRRWMTGILNRYSKKKECWSRAVGDEGWSTMRTVSGFIFCRTSATEAQL